MSNNCKLKQKNKKNVIDSLFQIEYFLRNMCTATSTLKFAKCLKNNRDKPKIP